MLVLFTTIVKSQTNSNDCNYVYKAEVIPSPVETSNADKFATLNWDFSKIIDNLKTITIEIQPIFDCYRSLDAKRLKDIIVINVGKQNNNNVTGSKVFKHTEMRNKCFKWRVVLKTDTCEKNSDWKFYSFY